MQVHAFGFVSTMDGYPWGGSEELWSRTALRLLSQGYRVSASVAGWRPPDGRICKLADSGVDVRFRDKTPSFVRKVWGRMVQRSQTDFSFELKRFLTAISPSLTVFSSAGPLPPIELLELCVAMNKAFAVIFCLNEDSYWVHDDVATRYRNTLPHARRCYFKSHGNWRLAEKQLGCEFRNAEIVANAPTVDYNVQSRWPPLSVGSELHLANVARLDPGMKGQDILFEVLAGTAWRNRKWRLTLYGSGSARDTLERLAKHFGLTDRISFAGYRPIGEIWAANHVLVMPSRCEGMSLAVIEAMLYARPVIATDVGGNAEVIEDGVTGFIAEAPVTTCVANALERCWERRLELEKMGAASARRIRDLLPADPVTEFATKLKRLVVRESAAS
jgi:glycosyltransferase involved in cell wall biosynthesis